MKRLLMLVAASMLYACGGCDGTSDCPDGANCADPNNQSNNETNNTNNDLPDGGNPDGGDEDDTGPEPMFEDPHPNLIPTEDLFTCEGEPQSSPERLRRIGRLEWTRSIGQQEIGNASLNPLRANPANLYGSWSADEAFDPVTLDQYFGFLNITANDWYSDSGKPEFVDCMYGATPDAPCVRTWTEFYLTNYVYFRTATPEEVDRLAAFAETAIDEAPDRDAAIRKITSAAWLTTGALFGSEMGNGADSGTGRALDNWELAKSLSYALSDWAPGAPDWSSGSVIRGSNNSDILAAAQDGSIQTDAKIEELVRALYGGTDPARLDVETDDRDRSRRGEYYLNHKLNRFFQEWLDYKKVLTIFKDRPSGTSAVMDVENVDLAYGQLLVGFYGYETTVDQQLDDMIARIVVEDQDVFNRLLTSRTYFVPSNLSDNFKATERIQYIYNVTDDVPDNRASRWIDLPTDERAGVLTHPAFLAAHGGNFDNDPSVVHRGKWVRENLLCGLVPDVPITVDASFPDSTADRPARERLEMAVGGDDCQACHVLMDPLGLPFEVYNHAGYLRETDHGSTPNGMSTLKFTGDASLDVDVADAVEMTELLGSSDYAKRCFIRNVFRYFVGRAETRADACVLTEMENVYDSSNGSLVSMLVSLMQSPAFTERHTPEEEVMP